MKSQILHIIEKKEIELQEEKKREKKRKKEKKREIERKRKEKMGFRKIQVGFIPGNRGEQQKGPYDPF